MTIGYTKAPRVTGSNQASRLRRLSRSISGGSGIPFVITLPGTEESKFNASPVAANTQAERSVVGIWSTEFPASNSYPAMELGYYKHAGYMRIQYMNTGADLYLFNADGFTIGVPTTFTSFAAAIVTVTANTTLNTTHYTVLVDATSGAITITLPTATSANKRIYIVKKIDASTNIVTIDGDGAELIDGAATTTLVVRWSSETLQSNGTSWFLI